MVRGLSRVERAAMAGIFRRERSSEPTQVCYRQIERRPESALFEPKECGEFAQAHNTPSEI